VTWSELLAAAPAFNWDLWLASGADVPAGAFAHLVVREPSFITGFGELWASESLEDWKVWSVFHYVTSCAPYLSDELVEANFDFYGRTLSGAQEVRDRWKRGVSVVESALGEAVGKEYVARHFPPSHKERMDELVANLVAAYRESIMALDWMGEETKVKALT
jgi:putative endopeptidase